MSITDIEARTRLTTVGKVLTIDIERVPGIAYAWEPKTRYIPARNFVEWPRMVCFAARWYGQKRVIFEAEWIDRDRMIQKAWDLYNEADVVYTYNGIRFDDKHLRSDWLVAGMQPPLPWKDVDLFRVVQQFGFESKSLDSVTRRLGRPGKELHYDMGVTWGAVEGDAANQRELKRYNIGDVELTEWLADRLRPWIKHPHTQRVGEGEKICPNCGCKDMTLQETKSYRAIVIDYTLYRCDNCGAPLIGSWHARMARVRSA